MNNLINVDAISSVVMHGDLSKLSPTDKLHYYKNLCESVGLSPLNNPFQYMKLNGKEILYAGKGCAEQLRKLHKVSITITHREKIDEIYVVTAEASLPTGRKDSSTGAVNITGLKGDALANAFMKAETKAKRRATLSLIGLGMLDESEVATIPTYQTKPVSERAEDIYDGTANQVVYTIPFGKYKDRTLQELDPSDLEGYVKYISEKAKAKGEPITGPVLEFMARAEEHLALTALQSEVDSGFKHAMAKEEADYQQSSLR